MKHLSFIAVLTSLLLNVASAQEQTIIVTGDAKGTIPINMTGFSGTAQEVLKFDLEISGFKFVSASETPFLLTGSNNGQVQGQLAEGKTVRFSRAYPGGNTRAQAHALANDVIFAITGKKGICQTKIAFKRDTGRESELYVADFDGYNSQALTSDKSEIAMPMWVPGSRKLVYCSWKNGATQIFSHDASTGARQQLLRVNGNAYGPAVSYDGTKLAVILNKGGSPDLYVCNIDGSGLKQLTKTKIDESSPCWSPDNNTICYVARAGTRPALFTVSASGGEPRQLRVGNVLNLTEPDWSPDGQTIVFTSQAGGENFTICTVPATGGQAEMITEGQDPSWASNSRTVVFTRKTNNKRVLSLLDVPTKRVKDVAPISGSCSQASWAR